MQPVFILSSGASGTSALVEVLNANGMTCLGAAFDIDNRYEYALAHFLESRNVGAAELIAGPDPVLDEYLTSCAELVRNARFCLDVDVDFMHLFNGRANSFGQRPHLVDYIRERQFRSVHFSRRGVFAEAVRLQLPHRLGANPKAAGAASGALEPFNLNIQLCERHMHRSAAAAKRMETWFRGDEAHADLAHEDVFDEDGVSEAGASLLARLFGGDITDRSLHSSASTAGAPDGLDGRVGNARDVIEAFAGGPYAEEVQQVLGPGAAS